ncbi:unnamed protein product [Orchesella dallaii]|uniref:Transmembrane protein n=1 Tax=Orchesella dallaii TaxID=48710 RepID=A0ABP1S074_9HEXA
MAGELEQGATTATTNDRDGEVDENENNERAPLAPTQPQHLILYTTTPPPRQRPTQAEEERFRICVNLCSSWLFMIVATLFLVCYLYRLEWTPETVTPISVFSLDFAVNVLYLTFLIDIGAAVALIVAYQDYMKPFRDKMLLTALGCLCFNELHGTFIWLWVWTGEFPRTCSRTGIYGVGIICQPENLLLMSDDAMLSLQDCKCDYGECLPECGNLRVIQHYFWGTYWLYAIRFCILVIHCRCLKDAICRCKWCWNGIFLNQVAVVPVPDPNTAPMNVDEETQNMRTGVVVTGQTEQTNCNCAKMPQPPRSPHVIIHRIPDTTRVSQNTEETIQYIFKPTPYP